MVSEDFDLDSFHVSTWPMKKIEKCVIIPVDMNIKKKIYFMYELSQLPLLVDQSL
jgi:hypothetical protein